VDHVPVADLGAQRAAQLLQRVTRLGRLGLSHSGFLSRGGHLDLGGVSDLGAFAVGGVLAVVAGEDDLVRLGGGLLDVVRCDLGRLRGRLISRGVDVLRRHHLGYLGLVGRWDDDHGLFVLAVIIIVVARGRCLGSRGLEGVRVRVDVEQFDVVVIIGVVDTVEVQLVVRVSGYVDIVLEVENLVVVLV